MIDSKQLEELEKRCTKLVDDVINQEHIRPISIEIIKKSVQIPLAIGIVLDLISVIKKHNELINENLQLKDAIKFTTECLANGNQIENLPDFILNKFDTEERRLYESMLDRAIGLLRWGNARYEPHITQWDKEFRDFFNSKEYFSYEKHRKHNKQK